MRNALLFATALCCTLACDRGRNEADTTPKVPEHRGGGPLRNEPPMVVQPPTPSARATTSAASGAPDLPGMPSGSVTGPALDSNGGSGAGAP